MKRSLVVGFIIIVIVSAVGLSRTAVNPECFAGVWYASDDQSIYLFQEGLIYIGRDGAASPEAGNICGAYAYSQKTLFLFVEGIEGLETERLLYLVRDGDSSCLCEQEDGSGRLYFVRYNP